MLEKALKFLNGLPEAMVRPLGNIVYDDLCLKMKPKSHTMKNTFKVFVVIGLLVFLYRRYFKK